MLIAMDDPIQAQHLLDCLDMFCAIFGMEVNTDPRKTCAVVFRDPRSNVSAVVLKFRGQVVPFRDSYDYLGLVVHATKGLLGALDALAASGNRAKQTLQSRCRQQRLTQFDIKCRLFDALVEPILSYGSHVWGPDMFGGVPFRTKPCDNSADRVHLAFLRHMTGCGKSTSIDVLLRDMNRLPLSYRWVVLASRWFMKLRDDMQADRLAYNVWVADIELMLDGCRHCWTYKLLDTLSYLGAVPRAVWDHRSGAGVTKEGVMGVCILEDVVKLALHKCFASRWQGLHHDPRSAPSLEHEKCIHASWVMPTVAVGASEVIGRSVQPRHMKLCMSFKMLQCLARFRVGWHYLESHSARLKRRHGTPVLAWSDRKCRLCAVPTGPYYDGQAGSQGGGRFPAEDLKHFMLECPAYSHIRDRYPSIFGGIAATPRDGRDSNQRMLDIFGCHQQAELAACIYSMNYHRLECLQPRPPSQGDGVAGAILPSAFEDVEMMRLGMMD
jgi:hypothetical protein